MFNSYHCQSFTLPYYVIYYITQKPSNPKGYQKLIQSCKYFFAKNPILVFDRLRYYGNDEWVMSWENEEYDTIAMTKTAAKIWVTFSLRLVSVLQQNIVSIIAPKLYRCEVNLHLVCQKLSMDELLAFHSIEFMNMHRTSVISKCGSIIPLGKIIESLPQFFDIYFLCDENVPVITSKTAKEISKVLNSSKLHSFALANIPETFDIEIFFNKFIKKNTDKYVFLSFTETISDGYKSRLEKIINEILRNKSPKYSIPVVSFPGMDINMQEALLAHRKLNRCW